MATFTTVVHIITCVLLILVVLIQSGKGAEISASLGGSSQTVFGSSGGANFFTRFTSSLAAIFMITSLYLTWQGGREQRGLFGNTPAAPSAPVAPANPTNVLPKAPETPASVAKTPAAPAAPADKK